ncbi:riboflavin synthase subunit alpha [Fluviispira sanaruensis]|uniref:Riboflavin synthase n=1 Tax=Fluviispira sanaruensis TaxID=2493639 RepID=A0A4P2VMT7_FLUSA|nr:riboflavin synthase subunit alpha [Fluviispira sanaruensis]BBH53374.1 riboflavin synthase subunit alpha [Fluviispira sanaruensis]
MFTGIVQAVAIIKNIKDHNGIRTFQIEFPNGFCNELCIGASVAVDGVCLTVTKRLSENSAEFDVIFKSLEITTLSTLAVTARVNVERAAKDGAEIGGHPLSGHIDFRTRLLEFYEADGNCRLRFALPDMWKRYIFPKGYIAINGASLTLSEVDKTKGFFDIWLIPETRRMTTFEEKKEGDFVNIEIERGTQVVVDTIRDTLEENIGKLYQLLEQIIEQKNIDLNTLLGVEKINLTNNSSLK